MQKQRKIDRRRPSRDFFLALMAGITILTVVTVGFLYYQARLVGRIARIPAFEFQLPIGLPFFGPTAQGSSFTDLFSGTGWLNASNTTLYQDFAMTTLSYPPKFEWEKLADEEAKKLKEKILFVRLEEDGTDKRCTGSQCLIQKGLELFLDGQKISLPSELRTPELLNISIGAIYPVRNIISNGADKFWILGVVTRSHSDPAKAGEESRDSSVASLPQNDKMSYRGYVYKFDPSASSGQAPEFTKIFEDSDFLSPYPGVFGFGGTSDNWLAIYGAYEGIAWQTKTKNSFSSFHNISRFFPIRVMGDSVKLKEAKERFVSFRPEVIRDGKNWYIYSLTPAKPKFIKLVEDEEEKISAAWDLTKNLGLDSGVESAFFAIESSGLPVRSSEGAKEGSLLALIDDIELRRFRDFGFDKSKPLEAMSSNINTLPGNVVSARISGLQKFLDGENMLFWLSNDGVFWKEAKAYETVVFTDPQEKLFWRVKFVPDDDLKTSPVLDRLGLEWQWVPN